MKNVVKFLRLRGSDKLYLVNAVLLVAFVRAGLTMFSYRQVSRWFPPRIHPKSHDLNDIRRALWGARIAAKCVPDATCLTTALAAQLLLAKSGHSAEVHVGVAKDEFGKFVAHAWLSAYGKILHGQVGHDLSRYTQIACLKAVEP